ncbi:unnamed protein product [Closterium sp. NIES-53]
MSLLVPLSLLGGARSLRLVSEAQCPFLPQWSHIGALGQSRLRWPGLPHMWHLLGSPRSRMFFSAFGNAAAAQLGFVRARGSPSSSSSSRWACSVCFATPYTSFSVMSAPMSYTAVRTTGPQQLREWYAGRGRSGGVGPCTYVLRTGGSRRETQNVAIFDLDFDAILAAMYAVTDSAEGDCYRCVLPDPSIEAAALGAGESAAPGTNASAAPGTSESTAPGAGDTTLMPLSRPVAVSLADPSGGPVLAHSSTVLPCPAAPSGLLSGLHLPSFSTNLRVTHCTCSRTGRHLATFTRRPGSSLYTLTTTSPPVTASGQVAASGQVLAAVSRSSLTSAPCSCRPLSHETLLWHHHLGYPSLPRLRRMASRTLVSGLPRSLSPLPPGPAPTCVPCVEGRQRAAPHSSEFPPTEAPLQTLHMDVWGPASVSGQGRERYFLLVVDDYSRYTTVFPLRRKDEVTEVLIDWIRGARRQLSESFGSDHPVLRLHSDRGGEFSSDLLRAFSRAEGIRHTFTLPASPQKNGIAERRIGMVMDIALRCASDQPSALCLLAGDHTYSEVDGEGWRCVRVPCLGISSFCPRYLDKLSSRAVLCVFLGFPPDAPGWQFYHPTSRRDLSSQEVTFDKSVCYYHLFPYRTAPLPPRPLFQAPGAPPVDPLPPQGPAPLGVSQVDPVEVAVDSGTARGAEPAGAGPGGAEPGVAESEGAELGGAEPVRVEPWSAEPRGAESGGAEPGDADRAAGPTRPAAGGASGAGAAGGAAGARAADLGGAGAGGTGAVGGPAGVVAAGAAGPGGARTGCSGAAGAGGAVGVGVVGAGAVATGGAAGAGAAGGTRAGGAAGVVAGDRGAEGTGAVSAVSGGAARPWPYYVPLLQQVLGLPPSTCPTPPLLSPSPVQSLLQLQPASPLPGPSPYSGPIRGLTERREPESRPESPESRPAQSVLEC